MKKIIVSAMVTSTILSGCCDSSNPLLTATNTPFGAPAFDQIKTEHFMPAFEVGIAEARKGVEAIVNNTEEPTFENTVEALERNGGTLNSVLQIFFPLYNANTNDGMNEVANEVMPKLTEYQNDVALNQKLFERVKSVYDKRDSLTLDAEQMSLLEDTYKSFARNGAALNDEDKAKYREITAELSTLGLKFKENVLSATNAFQLNIEPKDSALVAELPASVKEGLAAEAKGRGQEGWTVTLQAPSYIPFMTYSSQRDLKEKLWKAYNSKCVTGEENDNQEIVKRTAELRLRLANLLGYDTYADYVLEERMAENRQNLNVFINELLDATKSYADADVENLKGYAKNCDTPLVGEMMPWDVSYYSEKLKNEKYSFNEEEVKPYLQLENVQKGVFALANKLYGLKFVENNDVPKYHPDVKVFEVYDDKDRYMSLLYLDFFPRESKSGGAWMTNFREMYTTADGEEMRPFVTLCCNFTKPTENLPSLITFDELTTFLHEFGHGLHGIFAEGRYASITGTNVYRDFVELPSQIMENWATEKEFLDMFAVHYKTGEKMPEELIEKIKSAQTYFAAYGNIRQLNYAINDLAWHTITEPVTGSVIDFERNASQRTKMMPDVDGTCVATAFSHIFSGGYAAGYYSYKWAEVLEADAFSMFKEQGVFNQEVASSFRENVLSKGGTAHPMELYVKFRGHKPDAKALLAKMGVEPKK